MQSQSCARFLGILALFIGAMVQASPVGMTYQGRFFDDRDEPIDSGSMTIVVQVLNPSAQCLLYSESHNVSMDGADGFFSIQIGTGSSVSSSPTISFKDSISNRVTLSDPAMGCTGDTYTPLATDGRKIRLIVDGETMSPDMTISSSPYSLYSSEASLLDGKAASEFLQDDSSNVTQSNLQSFFDAVATLGNNQALRWNTGSSDWDVFTPGAAGAGVNTLTVGAPLSNSGTANDPILAISAATTSAAGTLSAADKTKLDAIESNATGDQTASEILSAVQTVDGAGSGLDADRLDGLQASAFLQSESDPKIGSLSSGQWCRTNGSTVICDVAPVVDTNTTYSNATTSVAGLMSAADKTKLDGIESNATGDQTASEILTAVQTVDGAGSGLDADRLDGLQASAFLQSESDPKIGSLSSGQWCRTNGSSVICDVAPVVDTNTTYGNATTGASGLMSASDKTKLNGIESGATADQSAAEISSLLQTVDGAGSGIDADRLDGQSSAYYRSASNLNAGNLDRPITQTGSSNAAVGQLTNNGGPRTDNGDAVINFANKNIVTTTYACTGSPTAMTLQNLGDGGSYSLVMTGAHSGSCTFAHSGLTSRYPNADTSVDLSSATNGAVVTFLRVGSILYISPVVF